MEEIKDDELAKFHKRKRKKHRQKLITLTTIFIMLGITLICIYGVLNQKSTIIYNEDCKVDYSVNLLENEFYKTDRLEGNMDVISSLIKDINVKFKYNLNLSEEIEYLYNYKITANIELKEKSKTNLIYSDEQVAINKPQQEVKSKRLEIVENVNINYNTYDEQVNRLIELYKLDNTVSEMSLNMHLSVVNKATGERINKDTNVMKITIPLDTKTVEITVNENVNDSQGEIIIQKENPKHYLILGFTMIGIGFIILANLIRYNSKTRSAEKMYEDELKKILFDYKSYIQKITTKIDYKAYKIIKINSFEELIGMREELQSPILMYTEEKNLRTIFMMMKDDMLFTYILGAKLIREKLIEESKKRKEGKKSEKNK